MKHSVEDILRKIGKWFNKERRTIFLVTFIVGMLFHLAQYTNQLLVEDGYWHYGAFLSKGWEVSLGRFGLPFVDLLRGTVVSTVLSSTLSCIIMGFTAIFLAEILQLKKTYVKVLVSLLLVVTPTFAHTLMYSYTADSYMLSMFFAVLTVYFLEKKFSTKNILFAIVSLCISLSLYQAYLGVTITLLLFCFLIRILEDRNANLKENFKKLIESGLVVLAGAILYYVLLKVVLLVLHLNLNDYKGANSILSIDTLKNLIPSMKNMYQTFFDFYLSNNILRNNSFFHRNILNLGLFFLLFVNFILLVHQNKLWKKPSKIFTLILGVLLIPVATCIIELITQQQEMSLLMVMPLFLPFILLLKQIDLLREQKQNNLVALVGTIGILLLGWSYTLGNHATYEASKMYQAQMYSLGIEINQALSEKEEYQDKPVLIVGHLAFSSDNEKLASMTNFDIQKSGSYYTYASFYRNDLTFDHEIIKKAETYSKLESSASFDNGAIFPEEGSIQIIDDIIVIRVGE